MRFLSDRELDDVRKGSTLKSGKWQTAIRDVEVDVKKNRGKWGLLVSGVNRSGVVGARSAALRVGYLVRSVRNADDRKLFDVWICWPIEAGGGARNVFA